MLACRAAEPLAGPAKSKSTSTLINEVQNLLASGSFKTAADDLREILARTELATDEESQAARAFCRYQLGFCQMKSADFAGAADSFKRFIADYPANELVPAARFMVLEAYVRQEDRAQMAAWLAELKSSGAFAELLRFVGDEKNAQFRRTTVLALMIEYARQGDLANLRTFLPFCDPFSLADISLNSALMEGGDAAFDKQDYALALTLYRMVWRQNEAVPAYRKQVEALTAELGAVVRKRAFEEGEDEHQADRDRLEALKQTLQFLTDTGYDQDLMLRYARCYDAMERYRLALAVYTRLYTEFPDHALAEQCRVSAFQTLLSLDEQEAALAAGREYLARYPQGKFEDEITVSLMQLYLTRGEPAVAAELGQAALTALPERRLADQITYLLGAVALQQQNWPDAFAKFAQVKEKWPQSSYVQEADYWGGMCYLLEGRFADAIAAFKAYLNNPDYKPARFKAEAFYRLGVAQYGLEAFAESETLFKEFLVLYPESPLVSEACSMLGDLRGADGDLGAALTMYQMAVQKATDADQDSYAVFQSARTYELQQRYAEIVELMKAYIARRGQQAQFAEAGLWIGKASKAQGNSRQALEIYLKTLADFGNDPALGGADQVQTQLLADLKETKNPGDLEFAVACLTRDLALCQQKNERALALRLTALLVRLAGENGRAVRLADLHNEQGLEAFSPLPLLVLAEDFAASGNTEGVERMAAEFKKRFAGSDLLPDMVSLQASACLAAKQYEKTIALVDEYIVRLDDGDPRTGLFRKLQADAFRLSGEWAKAVETYQKIFSIRIMRGSLAPETLYWIGICKREQGDVEKAFAFFQRVYVLYKGHPQWAAKAYEASVECLLKLGRTAEAVQTRKEMAADPAIQNTPEGRRAAEALRQGAEG